MFCKGQIQGLSELSGYLPVHVPSLNIELCNVFVTGLMNMGQDRTAHLLKANKSNQCTTSYYIKKPL